MALRLGTRASTLALVQANAVQRALEALGEAVELVEVATAGDETAPVPETEDKARFVKELERALLDGTIDLAVHSAKDVPSELPDGLAIVGVPARADARDALCLPPGAAAPADPVPTSAAGAPLAALGHGATVGTASLRRRSQLLALRPDLEVVELRGNVDTRLRRLGEGNGGPAAGGLDAIVLAAAGLARLDRSGAGTPLPETTMCPAAGQGCLALEGREDDARVRELGERLTDPAAQTCVAAERTVVMVLEATCNTPVGAHAEIDGDGMLLRAFVGATDGSTWVREELHGGAAEPHQLGIEVANRLIAAGASEILRRADAEAPGPGESPSPEPGAPNP